MEDIRQRLESELNSTMNRIRQTGGAIVVEELPGADGDNVPLAGDVDVIGVNEDRRVRILSEVLQLPGPVVRYNIRAFLVPDIRYRDDVWLTFP